MAKKEELKKEEKKENVIGVIVRKEDGTFNLVAQDKEMSPMDLMLILEELKLSMIFSVTSAIMNSGMREFSDALVSEVVSKIKEGK